MSHQFYTNEYINENYPDHWRTSCSDQHPNTNATVDGQGCTRCNALIFQREEWQQEVVKAAQQLLDQKDSKQITGEIQRLRSVMEQKPAWPETE